jgi:alpha-N-acetylglucosamine transferase
MIHSARAAGCRQPFVVMHLMTFEQVEQSLGREVVRELMEADVLFRQIEGVEKVFGSGAFAHIAKSRWQVAINKVRVWEMTEFDKGTLHS